MNNHPAAADIGFPRIGLNGFIASIFTFLAIAILVSVIRTALRISRLGRIDFDDGFLLLALVALAAACGVVNQIGDLFYLQIYASLKLAPFPPGPVILRYHRLLQAASVLEWVAIYSAKLSLLLFFRKLVSRIRLLERWWKIVFILVVLLGCVCIPLGFIVCTDFSLNFLTTCAPAKISIREKIYTDASVTIDVVSDTLVLSVPLALLWMAKLETRRKIALGAMLGLSVFMIIIAIVRVTASTLPSGLSDTVWLFFWQSMEAAVAVIMVSLTGLRSLFGQDASRSSSKRKITYTRDISRSTPNNSMGDPYDKLGSNGGIISSVRTLMRQNPGSVQDDSEELRTFGLNDQDNMSK